jgi:ABC-type transport system substrate-binding protein
MKSKIRFALSLLAIVAVLVTSGILTGCSGGTETVTATTTATLTTTVPSSGGTDGVIKILNPATANHQVERVPLAPRLDTLEGKSIYFIDVNWGSGDGAGAHTFLNLTAEWLEQEYNCTTTVVRKKGAYFYGDPDLFEEAAKNADAVVFGVSG